MNAVGTILTLIAGLLVLLAPRRQAVLGLFAGVCYITQGQQLDVGGFHFTAIRIILLIGFIRSLARGELFQIKLNRLDWVLLGYAIFTPVVTGVRSGYWQEPVGNAYNVFFSYFAFRCLVTSWEDVENLAHDLALLIVPLAFFMVLESSTGINVFNVMGGQEPASTRAGRLRCIGAFRGPHTSGTFGASLVPLFVGLYFIGRKRGAAVVGLIAATVITYTANASGPLMAYLSSLVGLGFWPQRTNMKRVKWGIIITLVAYGFFSKAPIWYIFSKISDLTGGDGWYRSYLMEQCWNHMSSWWLMGTENTGEWAVTTMAWGGADLCNMYVSCAANAGLGCLILFILILCYSFRSLGLALRAVRETLPHAEIMFWCIGCALLSHVITLFSVTYWDQMHVAWWALIAIISSACSQALNASVAEAPQLVETELVPDGEPAAAGIKFAGTMPHDQDPAGA